MVTHLFQGYMDNPALYRECERYWERLVEGVAIGLGQAGEWKRWVPRTYGDGITPMDIEYLDIYDGRSVMLDRAFRINQGPPVEKEIPEATAWLASYEGLDTELPSNVLTISLSLSEETATVATTLLRKWMEPATTPAELEAFIQRTLDEAGIPPCERIPDEPSDPLSVPSVEFVMQWDRSSASKALAIYEEFKANPQPSDHPPAVAAVAELLKALGGRLEVVSPGRSIPIPPARDTWSIGFLALLVGLREGIPLAAAGVPQVASYYPDFHQAFIRSDGGEICIAFPAPKPDNELCAPAQVWTAALDKAFREAGSWVAATIPSVMADPLVGPWLSGEPIPEELSFYASPLED